MSIFLKQSAYVIGGLAIAAILASVVVEVLVVLVRRCLVVKTPILRLCNGWRKESSILPWFL